MNESKVYTQRVRFSNFTQKSNIPNGRYLEISGYTPEALRNNLYDLRNKVEDAIKECERDIERGTRG